ncbi:unnamed protein product [Arabidopsis arenosa]|uniref:Nucleotide-sugar transporter family protein n=1 Tax=Arabidopsis arenosa TaxID=38785 RepID=A0A8S2AZM8_ARAAE|nr:unnamed protein product [Arabidopsis arenosa]
MSEITFEFKHKYIGDKIIECGVQIMTEEAEGSSSRKLDNYETESSSSEVDSHETESSSSEDGNGDENIKTSKQTDGDGDYDPQAVQLCKDENIIGDREFRQDTDSPEIKTKSTQGDHTVPGCWSSALCCEHKKAKPLKEVLLTILTSSQGILTTLSQSNGGYKYDYATVPFLAEVFKLIVSGLFLWREMRTSSSTTSRITTDWKSIMGNLKIVTTGILFRLFLKRKLSKLQWMAIGLLAVGTTTSQVKGCGEATCDSLFTAPIQGYLLGILSAGLSALAGIYTEFLMKRNNDTLYWQNLQLYTFGSLFNVARLIADDFRHGFEKGPWWQRIFDGYSITTWMVVLNLGSTGLLVSWLMKYADNIVKVYSTSMAMLLTMVASIYLFSFKPTLQLFLGIVICIMSLHMYFAPPHTLVDLPVTNEAHSKTLKQVVVEEKTDS